jgi:hypothetical protein
MCVLPRSFDDLKTLTYLKVRRGDHEGFVRAIQEAIANPIERYVDPQ